MRAFIVDLAVEAMVAELGGIDRIERQHLIHIALRHALVGLLGARGALQRQLGRQRGWQDQVSMHMCGHW